MLFLVQKGSWRGYKGNGEGKKEIFTVEKHVDETSRNEFRVLLVNDSNNEDSKTELLMKGNPFRRSCTIYKGDSIVAQVLQNHTMPQLCFVLIVQPRKEMHTYMNSLLL